MEQEFMASGEFIQYWRVKFRESFLIWPARPSGKEQGMAKFFVKNYTKKDLLAMVDFFWENKEELCGTFWDKSIATFRNKLDMIAELMHTDGSAPWLEGGGGE